MKPVTKSNKEPSYAWMMPYCQIASIAFLILAIVFLILGYKTFEANPSKSGAFKYAGFVMAAASVIAFIAVIYINSVSSNNLIDTMRSFRRSRAANPQINKKLKRNATDHELRA